MAFCLRGAELLFYIGRALFAIAYFSPLNEHMRKSPYRVGLKHVSLGGGIRKNGVPVFWAKMGQRRPIYA